MSSLLSKLQVLEATTWKGLTREEHLGRIFQNQPQKLNDAIMMIQQKYFGNNLDTVLNEFPTIFKDTDDDYEWELQSQAIDQAILVEARIAGTPIVPTDEPGLNYTQFELVFTEDRFSKTQEIWGERNEAYNMRVMKEVERDGSFYVYTVQLMTGDANLFVPYDELTAGKKFSGSFASVERTMSRDGREITYKSHMKMRNAFSKLRIKKKTPGNLKGRKFAAVFKDEKGTPHRMWTQYESFMFDNEFRKDINNCLMFGTSNRAADGSYKQKGESGNTIVKGSGIREQMMAANTSYYSTFSIDDLTKKLIDLSYGKLPSDKREFVLRTGEFGALQFHKSLEQFSQLYTPLRNMSRMYEISQNGFKMGMGYGGQFLEYIGPNGIKVNISVDSMYDDMERLKLEHPDGGFVESYRYDIMDVGTKGDMANIQRVMSKNDPTIHKYIPGLRDPYSPDGAFTAIGTAEDSWEEHKMWTGSAVVLDPSRTASMIHSLDAI